MTSGPVFRWAGTLPDQLPAEPFSHFQTPAWIEMLHRYGERPLCVSAELDGVPAMTWVLYLTAGDFLSPPRNPILRRLNRHLRAVHSPVISPALDPDERALLISGLLQAVRKRVRRLAPLSTHLQLDPVMGAVERRLWLDRATEAGYRPVPAHTYCAHLTGSTDDAFGSIRRERRTKVRKAERQGVTFTHSEQLSELREYWQVNADTRRRNGLPSMPWSHLADTWEALRGSGILHVFVARREDGRAGAGQIAYVWNGYVYLAGVSVAQWAIDSRLPANEFLQWNVLRWSTEAGHRIVDFAGAQPRTADPKVQAIDAFKASWGTELHESLSLELPGSRLRRVAARGAARALGGDRRRAGGAEGER